MIGRLTRENTLAEVGVWKAGNVLAAGALMLALSAAGILTPILGAIGHNMGSVAVILNSARLLGFKAEVSTG